jgi:hypothetical protein
MVKVTQWLRQKLGETDWLLYWQFCTFNLLEPDYKKEVECIFFGFKSQNLRTG